MIFFPDHLLKHLTFTLLSLLVIALPANAAPPEKVAGYPAEEALRLGEIMYRDGILPSGKPMKAIVQGDIEMDGTMSTCTNCHLRSGLGALEGGILSPPTNGVRLYAPLKDNRDIPGSSMKRSMFKTARPAYTRETLAKAMLTGEAPGGLVLSETMPRYELNEDEMNILIFYLENLSAKHSPGITDEEIRFATILTDSTPAKDRDALLLPLNAFIRDEWNARINKSSNRPGTQKIRSLSLDVWELKGGPESWGEQLEQQYRKQPVFAVLGGIAPGKWEPVHSFCEKNRIPCILPLTDLPVVSDRDWYTLYFSKGYYQEGETAAKYLSRVFALPSEKRVVQVFRNNDPGKALSRGFADTWDKLGNIPLINTPLADSEKTGPDFWKKLKSANPDAVLLIWLDPTDLDGIDVLATGSNKPSTIFASSSMLGGNYSALPDSIRDQVLLTYPTRLPSDSDYARTIAAGWMKINKIPDGNLPYTWKTYFMTRVLSRVLADMGNDAYRDYFLDIFDDGKDETNTSVLYPKLSFGPGQRYAAKGCYVVTISKGSAPKIVPQSEWVVY